MRKALSLILVAGLAGGGLAMATAKQSKPAPEIRDVGTPKNCVQIRQIRSTKIVDDSTIDFKMTGGKVFRNKLDYKCSGLKSEDRFTYRLSGSQLCNVDIISVLHNYGGHLQKGAGCGLGKFQQIEKVKTTG